MGITDKAFEDLDSERERLINELIDTIERNAVDNKATIYNVELWCKSWRKAFSLFGVSGSCISCGKDTKGQTLCELCNTRGLAAYE